MTVTYHLDPVMAAQLDKDYPLLRRGDLHHQCHRVSEHEPEKSKNRCSFPSDDAVLKLYYLALKT